MRHGVRLDDLTSFTVGSMALNGIAAEVEVQMGWDEKGEDIPQQCRQGEWVVCSPALNDWQLREALMPRRVHEAGNDESHSCNDYICASQRTCNI